MRRVKERYSEVDRPRVMITCSDVRINIAIIKKDFAKMKAR